MAKSRGKREKRESAPRRDYVFRSAAVAYRPPPLVQTGIVALDAMIGGGVPRGRFVEVYGPFKGGKTALCYEVARAFQQAGGRGRWTDAEHAFDGFAFERFGGDLERLDYDDETDTVEDYVHKAEAWIGKHGRSDAPKVEVVDSVAMLGTVHENETDMTKKNLDRAGQLYRGFRRLGGPMSRSLTTLLFVNQIRMKVGVYFGSPETTPGGKGPEYFATIRLRVSQGTLKRGKKVAVYDAAGRKVGMYVVVRVEKNRLMPDAQETELLYLFDSGFDAVHGALRLLANNGLVDERGRGEEGREAFMFGGKVVDDEAAFVDAHGDLLRSIWTKFRPENA